MFDRFSNAARVVLATASDEARRIDDSFVGTEHLLLGLAQGDGLAFEVLRVLGVTIDTARQKLYEIDKMPPVTRILGLPFSPRLKKVLALAQREARSLNSDRIETVHLLLGLVREGNGRGVEILRRLGLSLTQVRREVMWQLVPKFEDARSYRGARSDREVMWQLVPKFEDARSYRGARSDRDGTSITSCSFCGRRLTSSERMVPGINANICEHCIREWAPRLDEPGT